MCIIAIKKSGVDFPSEEVIENMWYRNPDGAGIMYTDGSGRVIIDKGYMTLSNFKKRIELLKQEIDVVKEAVVLHFRIGTSGGNVAANTHPFPISRRVEDLQALHHRAKIGVVHNGIITIDRPIKEISDTMEYIRTKLYPLYKNKHWFYKDADMLEKIERQITSKMAFLMPNREVVTVGKFITSKDGMVYSNTSYEGFKYYYSGAWSNYADVGYYNYNYGFGNTKGYKRSKYYERYYGTLAQVAHLMPLNDEDYLVEMDTGSMATVSDLGGAIYMDKNNYLYVTDYDDYGYEVAYHLSDNCLAFSASGMDVKFNEDKAIWMELEDDSFSLFTEFEDGDGE